MFLKFTEKNLLQSLFFNSVTDWRPRNLFKINSNTAVFKNAFYRTPANDFFWLKRIS